MSQKKCLLCEKSFRGRTDKKFCDDYCRNSYNNSRKMINNSEVRMVNNALAKNRKILEGISNELSSKYLKIKKENLLDLGYSFKYQTQMKNYTSGLCVLFCYDYYYFDLNRDWMIVAKLDF
jgi:hypothetical protein